MNFALVLGLLALSCSAPTPAPSPDLNRPSKVLTREFPDLVDIARGGRRVPIKIHYPEGTARHPLVLVSHGGGGNWDGHAKQAEDLATRGYVVFCVQHVGSDAAKLRANLDELGWRKTREALHRLTIDSAEVMARPRDLSFAIDRAIEWDREPGPLRGRLDTSRIAALGHSYGAYTVLAACGARPALDHLVPRIEPGTGLGPSLAEPRIRAGIVFSPQGMGGTFWNRESYSSIDRPLLLVSGSKDTMNSHDGKDLPPERRKEAFEWMPPGGKFFFWLEGADHLAFYDSPRIFDLPSRARADTQRIVKSLAAAFCDLHLREDAEAKKRLTEEAAQSLCGKEVTKASLSKK